VVVGHVPVVENAEAVNHNVFASYRVERPAWCVANGDLPQPDLLAADQENDRWPPGSEGLVRRAAAKGPPNAAESFRPPAGFVDVSARFFVGQFLPDGLVVAIKRAVAGNGNSGRILGKNQGTRLA